MAERQLFVRSREDVADIADAGTAALTLPAEITRATHQGIAAIPFGILEQIPATAQQTKVVREIHDEISRGVYQAISGTTRGIAGLMSGLTGAPRPSPRPHPLPPHGRATGDRDDRRRTGTRTAAPTATAAGALADQLQLLVT